MGLNNISAILWQFEDLTCTEVVKKRLNYHFQKETTAIISPLFFNAEGVAF